MAMVATIACDSAESESPRTDTSARADAADANDAGDTAADSAADDSGTTGATGDDALSDSAGDDADTASPPVLLDALCGPLAAATCRVHLGCRSGSTRDALFACEAHVGAVCDAERPRLEARIAAGRLRFDAAELRVCLTHLELLACGAPAEMQAALGDRCDGVLVGLVGGDEACADAGDCAPGLACLAGDAGGGACPGRCAALREADDPCDAELAPCAAGLSCEAGVCVATRVGMAERCVASAQCPDGFCEAGEAGAFCVPPRGRSAACDDDEQCADGDYCQLLSLDGLVLEVGVCAERLAAGAVCEPLVGGCAAGLACDEATGTCAAVPDSAGEGCVADVAPCGEGTGLVCEVGVCEVEPFVGDACDPDVADATCRFGFCAREEASGFGRCRDFAAPLSPCAGDAECGALACVGGHCDRPPERCNASLHDINIGFRYRIR